MEDLRRGRRVARHEQEQLVPPQRHALPRPRHQGLAAGEIGGFHHLEGRARDAPLLQRPRHVRILEVAEAQGQAREPVAQVQVRHPLGLVGPRNAEDLHAQQHVALVQHLVVLEVVQHRRRHELVRRRQEHRSAGHAQRRMRHQAGHEGLDPQAVLLHLRMHQFAAAAPAAHQRERRHAERQREPRAFHELDGVGGEERRLDREERQRQRPDLPARQTPAHLGQDQQQQRSDEHGAGDGNAVGDRQVARTAEVQHHRDHGQQHRPVHPRQVDLALAVRRGVDDLHARQVAVL